MPSSFVSRTKAFSTGCQCRSGRAGRGVAAADVDHESTGDGGLQIDKQEVDQQAVPEVVGAEWQHEPGLVHLTLGEHNHPGVVDTDINVGAGLDAVDSLGGLVHQAFLVRHFTGDESENLPRELLNHPRDQCRANQP